MHPCSASVFFFFKGYPLERNISPKSKQSLQSTKIYLLMDLAKKGYKVYSEEIVRILPSFKTPVIFNQAIRNGEWIAKLKRGEWIPVHK